MDTKGCTILITVPKQSTLNTSVLSEAATTCAIVFP